MTLRQLQEKQGKWSSRNFPNAQRHHCLIGLMEELGELSHAHLKAEQGIRLNEDHEMKRQDAVGDIAIFLAGYCNANNLDLQKCVQDAWDIVETLDWVNNGNNE